MLTSYDGNTLTYDDSGNPLNDGTWTYTWEGGRNLVGLSKLGTAITYTYNRDGIRTGKTVNGVVTTYVLNGDRVTSETTGAETIYFRYDSNAKLISMNMNGIEYYYFRNAQGDIAGLFDRTGAVVVEYSYDAWGNILNTTGSLASTVGVKNPYRYRGYRYDEESGLYYLQSRYYKSEWGRFLNSDVLFIGNLYNYCFDNPVMNVDENGYWPAPFNISKKITNLYYEIKKLISQNTARSDSVLGYIRDLKNLQNKGWLLESFNTFRNSGHMLVMNLVNDIGNGLKDISGSFNEINVYYTIVQRYNHKVDQYKEYIDNSVWKSLHADYTIFKKCREISKLMKYTNNEYNFMT